MAGFPLILKKGSTFDNQCSLCLFVFFSGRSLASQRNKGQEKKGSVLNCFACFVFSGQGQQEGNL